jgi:hypothetical protein
MHIKTLRADALYAEGTCGLVGERGRAYVISPRNSKTFPGQLFQAVDLNQTKSHQFFNSLP